MSKTEVIAEVLSWRSHDDDTKIYFIKSYLMGWTTEEKIHEVTERDRRAK